MRSVMATTEVVVAVPMVVAKAAIEDAAEVEAVAASADDESH